jgi:hypothetical protein
MVSDRVMQDTPLTESEARYLKDLQRLPTSSRSRVIGWTLELVPGIALFSYGLIADSQPFLVLGFLSQLYFALWRMYAQLRGFRLLRGIAQKAIPTPAAAEADIAAPPVVVPKGASGRDPDSLSP